MDISIDISEKLFPNLATVIVQLISTLVLLLILKKFLWKPARRYMEQKAELVQKPLQDAIQREENAKKANEEADKRLADAAAQARGIVEKGREEGERTRAELVSKGQEKAEQMIRTAQGQIASDREKMESELQKDMVNAAMDAAAKILSQSTGEKEHEAAVKDFVKEMGDGR